MRTVSHFVLILLICMLAACQENENVTPAEPATQPAAPTIHSSPSPSLAATSEAINLPTQTPWTDEDSRFSTSGVIAFYSDRDGNPEIYTIHSDGSGLRRLTDDPGFDDSPAISPDGRRILFLTARHDPNPRFPDLKYEIYVMDIGGENQLRLTETEAAEGHPAWSPDGAKISFDADSDGDGFKEIYLMDIDSMEVTRLTFNAANDQFADWSPDGRQIAFSSDRNGNWDIFSMDADGSNQQALSGSPNWELFPAWSPDGTQIAFMDMVPNSRNTDIFLMNADGSNLRQLTATPRFDENPTWSPDGSQIAFQTERDGQFEIYLMTLDGSDQRPLATHAGDDLWPSWGPAAVLLERSRQELGLRETFQAALGDLDGDGDLDAIIVCHQAIFPSKVYLNDGTGMFSDSGMDFEDARFSGTDVNVIDVNGDGHLDVHVMYYDANGAPDAVFLNDGEATFADSGLQLDEDFLAWGDLDGDGDVDNFGKRWGKGYVVMLNDGSGNFTVGWEMDNSLATIGDVALVDFDGDGDLDALVANGFRDTGSQPSSLLLNDGRGQFVDSGQVLFETMGAHLAVGDLNLDGSLDVFVTNMDRPNQVWLYYEGRFIDSGWRLGSNAEMSGRPSLGDLDGDGDLDAVVGRFRGGAEVWFNIMPVGGQP